METSQKSSVDLSNLPNKTQDLPQNKSHQEETKIDRSTNQFIQDPSKTGENNDPQTESRKEQHTEFSKEEVLTQQQMNTDQNLISSKNSRRSLISLSRSKNKQINDKLQKKPTKLEPLENPPRATFNLSKEDQTITIPTNEDCFKKKESFQIDEEQGSQKNPDQQQKEKGEIQVQVKMWDKLKVLGLFVGIPILLLASYLIFHFIYFGNEINVEKESCIGLNRDENNNCECFADYYVASLEKNDCVGPMPKDIPLSQEDIVLSLEGQSENIAVRIMKERQIEYYQYNIENIQTSYIGKNQTEIKNNTIQHNMAIITTNVKKDYFSVLAYFINSTYKSPGEEDTFTERYPLYYSQPPTNTTEDEDTIDSPDQLPLTDHQKKQIQDNNVTIEEYFTSNYPIIRANISKTGEILNMVYPITMPSELKKLLPTIMNQYSPPLTLDKFQKVETTGKRRRILKDSTSETKPNNTQPGMFAEESPDFQAEVDPETNEAKINKNYKQNTDSNGGTQVKQDSNFNAQSKMKNGRMDESAASSGINMKSTNPEDDNPPPSNNDGEDGEDDGEIVQNATEQPDLLREMKVDNFSVFKFKKVELLEESDISKVMEDLEKNFQINNTFPAFQQELIDEMNYLNNIPPDGIDPEDEEAINRRMLSIFGDMFKEEELTEIIPKKSVSLFTFSVLGIRVNCKAEFVCYERGEDEDAEEEVTNEVLEDECNRFPLYRKNKNKYVKDKCEDLVDDALLQKYGTYSSSSKRALQSSKDIPFRKNDTCNSPSSSSKSLKIMEGEKRNLGDSPKDVCLLYPVLTVAGLSLKPAQVELEVTIAKYLKGMNYLRFSIIYKAEKVITLVNSAITDWQDNIAEIVDLAMSLIDVEESVLVQSINSIKDLWTTQIQENFSELETKTNEIIAQKAQPFDAFFNRIKSAVDEQFYYYFLNTDAILSDFKESFLEDNLVEFETSLDAQAECSNTVNQMLKDLKENIEYQRQKEQSILTNMKNIYMNQEVFQPILETIVNLQYLTIEDSMDNQTKYALNMANSLINNALQGKVNIFLDQQSAKFTQFQQEFSENFEDIFAQVLEKIKTLQTKCQEKKSDSFTDSEQNLQSFQSLINYSSFLEHPELNADNQKEIQSILSAEFQQDFRQTLENHSEQLAEIKDFINEFITKVNEEFQENTDNMVENLLNLSVEIFENIKNSQTEFFESCQNLINSSTEFYQELLDTLGEGNPENKLLSSLDDLTNGVEDLQNQVSEIKLTYGRIKETVTKVTELKNIPNKVTETYNYLKNVHKAPFQAYKDAQIAFLRNDQVTKKDFNTYGLEDIINNLDSIILNKIEDEIKIKIIEATSFDFPEAINTVYDRVKSELEARMYDKLTDLDGMFADIIKKYIINFEVEKTSIFEKTLFEKSIEKRFYYITPIGIPLYVKFALEGEIKVDIQFGINLRSITLEPALEVGIYTDVEGGVDLIVFRMGAYARATIFLGILTFSIMLGFTGDKFFGKFYIEVYLESLTIEVGLFVQYLWFRFKKKCWGRWVKVCIYLPDIYWTDRIPIIRYIIRGFNTTKRLFTLKI